MYASEMLPIHISSASALSSSSYLRSSRNDKFIDNESLHYLPSYKPNDSSSFSSNSSRLVVSLLLLCISLALLFSIHSSSPSIQSPPASAFRSISDHISAANLSVHEPSSSSSSSEQTIAPTSPPPPAIELTEEDLKSLREKQENYERRDAIRASFQHAFKAYERHAWGHDELRPLSQTFNDWVPGGIGLTIIDSLDTMLLMGLDEEYSKSRKWIEEELSFEREGGSISVFETNIRILGGLLSAYDLTDRSDTLLLEKAIDIADRLLYSFPSKEEAELGRVLPATSVNLANGKSSSPKWTSGKEILAGFGTLQMEFYHLSHLTGNPIYGQKAKKLIDVLYDMNVPDGLFEVFMEPKTLKRSGVITMGGLGDSFYEYLLKTWVLTNGADLHAKEMYEKAMDGMEKHMVQKTKPSSASSSSSIGKKDANGVNWKQKKQRVESEDIPNPSLSSNSTASPAVSSVLTYVGEYRRGATASTGSTNTVMEHLACFIGGLLALGSKTSPTASLDRHFDLAVEITNTCHEMYDQSATKLAPDSVRFHHSSSIAAADKKFIQRPETIESFFYLWRYTKDKKYRDWGWAIFEAMEKYTKLPDDQGYASIRDVTYAPTEAEALQQKSRFEDLCQSFYFAETLKYLFLLFSEDDVVPLDRYVFNTEAHPFKIWDSSNANESFASFVA